jgi:hypothetical protein
MMQAMFYPTFWLQFWLAALTPPRARKESPEDARKT